VASLVVLELVADIAVDTDNYNSLENRYCMPFLILFSVFYGIISISADRVAPELRNALTVSAVFFIKAFYSRKAGVIFMQEIWKDIKGYEGKYQISNLGNVKSFLKGKEYLLKPYSTRGYLSIGLWDGQKKQTVLIHRLVASAFIPNPNGYKEINHKDENKSNNNINNLEWCTREYNMSYGTARLRQGISSGKPIEQLTLNNIVIAWYCSAEIACKLTNIDSSSIIKCCNGKRKYAGGYMWRYQTN